MNLLLEIPGERRSRLLFVCAVALGLAFSPVVAGLLERWMPSPALAAPAQPGPAGTSWDLRSM